MTPYRELGPLEVRKLHKRLVICTRDTGSVVYHMPGFLRPVQDRSVLARLAERLMAGNGISAIIAFETAHNPAVHRALSRERARCDGQRTKPTIMQREARISRNPEDNSTC